MLQQKVPENLGKLLQALLQLLTQENEEPIYLSPERHDHGKHNG